jgi:hypothetical protein
MPSAQLLHLCSASQQKRLITANYAQKIIDTILAYFIVKRTSAVLQRRPAGESLIGHRVRHKEFSRER